MVHLPCLQQSPCNYDWLDESTSARPIPRFFNGTKEQESWLLLLCAVLSASPRSGSNYIVAALSCCHRGAPGLALWQPGMTSWYLCRSARIDSFSGDLAFYQGKLYVVRKSRPRIFAFFSLGRTSTVSVCSVLSIIRLIGLSLPRPLIQRGATWWYGVKNCY